MSAFGIAQALSAPEGTPNRPDACTTRRDEIAGEGEPQVVVAPRDATDLRPATPADRSVRIRDPLQRAPSPPLPLVPSARPDHPLRTSPRRRSTAELPTALACKVRSQNSPGTVNPKTSLEFRMTYHPKPPLWAFRQIWTGLKGNLYAAAASMVALAASLSLLGTLILIVEQMRDEKNRENYTLSVMVFLCESYPNETDCAKNGPATDSEKIQIINALNRLPEVISFTYPSRAAEYSIFKIRFANDSA